MIGNGVIGTFTALAAVGLLAFPGSLTAFVSHRCTDTMKLDGTANLGNKLPAPTFKLPDVSVKKCLDVDSDASATEGKATQTCHFENSGSAPATFTFCDMVELSSAADSTPIDNPCNMGFDNTAKKWLCTKDDPKTVSGKPGAHFGCQVVTLGPAGSPTAKHTTPPLSVTSTDFKDKHAWNFQVSYADIFNLNVALCVHSTTPPAAAASAPTRQSTSAARRSIRRVPWQPASG